jgi:hypothetical protein
MNKKLFLLFVFAVTITISQAQSFQVGLKAGATLNKIDGQSFKDKFTFGYHLGAYAKIKVSEKLSLQPEVLFNQTNVDTSTKFSAVYQFNNISKVQLNQLTIPVLLNYSPNKLITLQAGPQYSINMKKELTLLQNGREAFNFNKWHIYGRYNIGLSNLNDIDNRESWKSQQAFIGLGMKL